MNALRSFLLLVTWITAVPLLAWPQPRQPPARVSLDQVSQIFGLSVASSERSSLLLATPMGLYAAGPQGSAELVPGVDGYVMAFAVHPKNPRRLLAGGHVGRSGSIGLLRSNDGGKTWAQLSEDAAGHVGFHILEFSKADPETIYGITNGLLVSSDGGRTWRMAATLPDELIHFAASARQANTVYAATRKGLFVSHDQGAHWAPLKIPAGIVSMVHVTPSGQVYAFVIGAGLLVAREPKLAWTTVSGRFEDQVLLRMAIDPASPNRFYAATLTGAVVTSADGGRSWGAYEGMQNAKPEIVAKGRELFKANCQTCHGPDGKGQHTTPGFDPASAPAILAPPLDDSAHGWHHSDENLVQTILNGSPVPDSPMVGWKERLSRPDAESLVAYIKSLWSLRSIACQGARHMACMRH